MRKPLIFNAFSMCSVSHMQHGMWTKPNTRQLEYATLDPWLDLARLLERGMFDALFIADVIGVYDQYRGGYEIPVREAMQIPINEPSSYVSAMASVTEHLGFAFTSSVIQEHPFGLARRMSTLDHLTRGRVAWNIVTSFLHNAAQNYSQERLLSGEERYAWAEEYMEVVYKLWEGSWEDDAVVKDLARGIYADPAKVHKINHKGPRYDVVGPHLSEPSPQRTPVLYQAGSSSSGRAFAARHAEGVFLNAADNVTGAKTIRDLRQRAVDAGRLAEDLLCIQLAAIVVGSTEAEAKRLARQVDEDLSWEAIRAHHSANVGVDLSIIDPDRKISDLRDDELKVPAIRSMIDGSALPTDSTFRELVTWVVQRLRIDGTPEQVADQLQTMAEKRDLDGFNLMYVTTPGSFEDFIEHVAPVLQDRGLMKREHGPRRTMREKLYDRGPFLPDHHPARSFRKW